MPPIIGFEPSCFSIFLVCVNCLIRRFTSAMDVPLPRAIRFLIDTFGEKQICIGTDYPFAMGDFSPMKTLQAIDRETLKRVAFKNARRFLGLPAAPR